MKVKSRHIRVRGKMQGNLFQVIQYQVEGNIPNKEYDDHNTIMNALRLRMKENDILGYYIIVNPKDLWIDRQGRRQPYTIVYSNTNWKLK